MFDLYLPTVKHDVDERDILIGMILNASWQQRRGARKNDILMRAAQWKADDMAERDYFGHVDPDGGTVNEYVRAFGYPLPDYYPIKGNNEESIVIGARTPQKAIETWLASDKGHRVHIAGENSFFREQTQVGAGRSVAKDGRVIFVFLSAP